MSIYKANASIQSVNIGLSSMEQTASKATRGASADMDGMTESMMKGVAGWNLLAGAIRHAVDWIKKGTVEAGNRLSTVTGRASRDESGRGGRLHHRRPQAAVQ